MVAGRIRTIKPEWLEDELLITSSAEARVLSIALILMADDHGRGRGNPDLVIPQVFPRGGKAAVASYAELEATGFFRRYVVRGQTYFEIRNWEKHQKVNHPGKPRVPPPCNQSLESSRESLEDFRESQESLLPDHDLIPHTPTTTPRARARECLVWFLEWFNKKNGRNFQPRDQLITWVQQLLAKGYSRDDLWIVAEAKRLEWRHSEDMRKHINPSTLLRPNNFERYIDPAREEYESRKRNQQKGAFPIPLGVTNEESI